MYGSAFGPTRVPIKGDEYLKFVQKFEPRMEWDEESEELYFEFGDDENGINDGEIWYPSLYSIKYILIDATNEKTIKSCGRFRRWWGEFMGIGTGIPPMGRTDIRDWITSMSCSNPGHKRAEGMHRTGVDVIDRLV
jgi:hypothetical protein